MALIRLFKKSLTALSSTTFGSINMAPTYKAVPAPAYKVSKAALNMLTVQYAQSFVDDGFTIVAVSPGVSISIQYPSTTPLLTHRFHSGYRPVWVARMPT
jgi:NAD(P)-dependent dehydrogenase (short-subunit alcohol dehydrogenase family)